MARERKATRSRKRTTKEKAVENHIPEHLIPTGCTLLNCVLSDSAFGGYRKGTIVNLIGDSSAGKSLLAFTTFAAMSAAGFQDYTFIYDDAECADTFDIPKLFGKNTAKRIKAPAYDKDGEPLASETIEDFHMYVKDALKTKRPFVYILDSFDSLDAEADKKKIDEALAARRKGNKTAGSYGTSKARKSSDILRNIRMDLKKTNSLLVVVSQVRDNLNAGQFGSTKTRSGGRALKHYSWHEVWLYLGKRIKSKDMVIGVESMPKLGKNRETGKIRDSVFTIYYDLGVDDVGANIDFLISQGNHMKKPKNSSKIKCEEFDFDGSKQKLIKYIEQNDLETRIQEMVQEDWREREDSLKLDWRKKRFE